MFGPKIKAYQDLLLNLKESEIEDLIGEKDIVVPFDGSDLTITKDMVDIRIDSKEGFNVGMENNKFIILNTELTKELIYEGYARELVSKVQNLRKTKDFDIADRIKLYYSSDSEVKDAIKEYEEFIKGETLSLEIIEKENLPEEVDLNGHTAYIDVERA